MYKLTVICLFLATKLYALGQVDPNKISIYIEPIFNTQGPEIVAGSYSEGLASEGKTFTDTIINMKKEAPKLTAEVLYMASVQLYNRGYLDESVYWFYLAQCKARLIQSTIDRKATPNFGSPSFERINILNSFYQLAGPTINGYAFSNPENLLKILKQVQVEFSKTTSLQSIYPDIKLPKNFDQASKVDEVSSGMAPLFEMLKKKPEYIAEQRANSGIDKVFKDIKSKKFPTAETTSTGKI